MLNLFTMDTCPYCQKVIKFLEEHNIEYNSIDVKDKNNMENLIRLGEKKQVPFLVDTDHGVEMYESEDIIEYLKTLL